MEKRKAKSTYASRDRQSGFYCDVDIGYRMTARGARHTGKRTESHKDRGNAKERG